MRPVPHTPRRSPVAPRGASGTEASADGPAPLRDYVTGLDPRGLLEQRLSTLLPIGKPLAMVIVDVIGLKAVNEQEGFLAGDALLRAAADRLRDVATESAIVARLGGDELVAVFLGDKAGESAQRAADALARAASQPGLRAASLAAAEAETSAEFIERLYATLRRS